MRKTFILLILVILWCAGCANTSWINYCQTHFLKPVNSTDGKLLYYKTNTIDSNPGWIRDFNACLKYGHEARGLIYSKSMWQTSEMCYRHEDCIQAVYGCLEKREYVRVP